MTTDQTAADRLVAEARRAVHESLTVFSAPEADRVRALIADLETAVEGRTAIHLTAAVPVPPPADRAAVERAMDALKAGNHITARHLLESALSPADVALAVLSEPTDQTAALPLTAVERQFLTFALDLAADEMASRGDEFGDEDEAALETLRRMAAEEQPAETQAQPESCAHCGKSVQRITGTLRQWWVHEPGGNTICHPEQAASSPRATPQPAEDPDHRHAAARRFLGKDIPDDEEQPAICGRTVGVTGRTYPPCARRPRHWQSYCRSTDGSLFLAVDSQQPETQP